VICGLATQALIQQHPSVTLDSPFWPLIQKMVPNPDPSIKVVTLRQLADQMSGLQPNNGDGPLNPPAPTTDIWSYLVSYLAQPLVGTPGQTYNYNNTNFTILQGVIDQVAGVDFVTFAAQYILTPAGIDNSIYNAAPDPSTTATLGYVNAADTTTGAYFGPFDFVAPGGYITDIREMIKILIALRGISILPQSVVTQTLTGLIGWDGSVTGNFGAYYQKNGGLTDDDTPAHQMGSATRQAWGRLRLRPAVQLRPTDSARRHRQHQHRRCGVRCL
jgi:CubicO group peptidase (beta-lactamase class C family)